MPHQQYIADVSLEIDPDTGLLAYSEVVFIGPRQVTGKTELLLPVMAHRCLGFDHAGPQRVLYTAQNTEKGREKWRDVHVPRIESSSLRHLCNVRRQRNSEAIIWQNGSMWMPGSTTKKTAGTSDTIDMGVIDEAWAQSDSSVELGMRPAMMTRPWSQMWVTSMIPGISRAVPGTWSYLANKREIGRERVKNNIRRGTAFFDFTAPEGANPEDPETWLSCMGGIGRTVRIERIQEDCDSIDPIDFAAEYLSWAPNAKNMRWTLIKKDRWDSLLDEESQIENKLSLAAEIDDQRAAGWIGAAGKRYDEDWHIELIEPGNKIAPMASGVDWMENRIVEIWEKQKPYCVVIDPRRPASSLIVPLRNRGIKVITPDQNSTAAACGRFYDYTGANADFKSTTRLHHLGQYDIDDSLANSRKLETGVGSFTIVKKGSSSGISPLYVVILALYGSELAPDMVPADIFL